MLPRLDLPPPLCGYIPIWMIRAEGGKGLPGCQAPAVLAYRHISSRRDQPLLLISSMAIGSGEPQGVIEIRSDSCFLDQRHGTRFALPP
jgi:hypothetical protein